MFYLGVFWRPFFLYFLGCRMDQLYYFAMFCIGTGCAFAVFTGW
nr:MAG TPA: hypothetical protein [Inoviridae sp.]